VKDSRILSSGYNGVAKGCCECNKMYARSTDGKILFTNYLTKNVTSMNEAQYRKEHHEFADKYEIHAEMNCLGFALKNNTDITGAQLYLTTSPCLNCSKLIIVSGIKEVYFLEEYDDTAGVSYLLDNGVLCEKIEE
jgi:dCMP deaminase